MSNEDKKPATRSKSYPVVGRPHIDLTPYFVKVKGRQVIDYEKIKNDYPDLYKELVTSEIEASDEAECN